MLEVIDIDAPLLEFVKVELRLFVTDVKLIESVPLKVLLVVIADSMLELKISLIELLYIDASAIIEELKLATDVAIWSALLVDVALIGS